MSNWILRAAEDWLKPVYSQLHQQLAQHNILHADGYTGYHSLPEQEQAGSTALEGQENGLDPFQYLVWVLQTAPGMNKTTPDWAAKIMPENALKACFAGNRG